MTKFIYLGNSQWSNGKRIYKENYINSKRGYELVSWIDYHCIICGRFLRRNKKKICDKCFEKYREEYMRIYNLIYRHANKIEVGNYI